MANKPIVGNVTVGGTAKTISDGYVCIGGVWKPIVETYVNIGGVWKPAWERGYTWKQYDVVITQTFGVSISKASEELFTGGMDKYNSYEIYSSYEINDTTGAITLTGSSKSYQPINASMIPSNTFTQYPYIKYGNKYYKFDPSGMGLKGFRMMPYAQDDRSQGEYIGEVTAENENAYPANGIHTDGFWYVFQG